VYSYFESRGGKFDNCVFFGLQYIVKRYLCGVQVTKEKIDEAEALFAQHFGQPGVDPAKLPTFNRAGWEHILEKHGGKLPIKIKAVPEGTMVPVKNVLMTVENTDPECYWLANYLETLLVQVWYPMTVATSSYYQKALIARYLEETGDPGGIMFKLHDFGFRGVSSMETSALGASAHLVNFMGTDTVSGLQLVRKFYNEPDGCVGFSIPASEHSTITSWGQEHEVDAMRNMLTKYPEGLVACVSDSFNIYEACRNLWGGVLKDEVMSRNGTLVIRPDSGTPKDMVLACLECLGEKFPVEKNEKGYKVLDSHVRIIQGDGISYETIGEILEHIKKAGWSADNVGFGSGGALLQKLNRDTQKCAFKCCHTVCDGVAGDVFKSPVDDPGKKSKKGRLFLHEIDGQFVTVARHAGGRTVWKNGDPQDTEAVDLAADEAADVMVTIFENGEMVADGQSTFTQVRERATATAAK
jgi:nicotinamide phosphoribosyltransferase